jgi:hypothetical protein
VNFLHNEAIDEEGDSVLGAKSEELTHYDARDPGTIYHRIHQNYTIHVQHTHFFPA